MLDNLVISNDRAQCKIHGKDLVFAQTKLSVFESKPSLAICSECKAVDERMRNQAAFKCYTDYGACSISCLNLPEHRISEASNDYADSAVESFLVSQSSSGYSNGSLVYIPERNLLAVCESNGKIAFWSIRDQIALEKTIAVGETIKFAKYFNRSETKRYFVVCSNRGFHIYNTVNNQIVLKQILESDPLIIDLECITEEEKLLSVGFESNIGVWDLQTMKIAEVLDMSKYNIDTRIHRVIYMKESRKLALEHEKGLSIFDYNQYKRGIQENLIQHYLVENKTIYGCVYLQQNKRFLLKNNFSEAVLLEEEGLVKIEDLKGCSTSNPNRGDNNNHVRLIGNEDESLVVGNHSGHNCSIYGNSIEKFLFIDKFVQEGGDIEVLHNQHRYAVADKKQGLVLIFRTNCGKSLFKNLYKPGLIRETFFPKPLASASIPFTYVPALQILPSAKPVILPVPNLFGAPTFSAVRPAIKVMRNSRKDSSAEKLGKKIKKVQVKPKPKKTKAEVKKKAKATKIATVKAQKTKKSVSKASEKKVKKSGNEIVEMVRLKKTNGKSKKEEKVWVVLEEEKGEKKQRIRVRKNSNKDQKRGRKNSSVSQERSRSRSESKSLTRKAK